MQVFLFPLPKVSYQPHIRKPLNIFEPRYIEMIEESIKRNIPVALCYGLPERGESASIDIVHESLGSVKNIAGCGFPKLLNRSLIGKEMLIILIPFNKIRILEILETDTPYIVAEYEIVDEFETILPQNTIKLKRVELEFRKWAKSFFKNKEEYDKLINMMSNPTVLIDSYTEFVIPNPVLKQVVLELDNYNDKLDCLTEFLEG